MIDRTILEEVLKCIQTKPITIITGSRQVGKSTLCKELFIELESIINDESLMI